MKRHPAVNAKSSTDRHTPDVDSYVQRVVDAAPRLTPEQRDRLALLLRGAGASR
jgi:hypothetical protein